MKDTKSGYGSNGNIECAIRTERGDKMNDSISRQAAIKETEKKEMSTLLDWSGYSAGFNDALKSVVIMLEDLPSAERKGHWEYLYDGNYKCSNCGSWWSCEDEPCEEGLNY